MNRVTPGPWQIIGQPMQARIVGPNGEAVAACRAKYNDLPSYLTRDANAALIAAAPQLAALAQLVIDEWEAQPHLFPGSSPEPEGVKRARAILETIKPS